MKTYRSSSFAFEFTGTRSDAIKKCVEHLAKVKDISIGRYTWRADDDSGFTIRVYDDYGIKRVELYFKWNATRN